MKKDIDFSIIGSEIIILAEEHPWKGFHGKIIGTENWGKKEGHAYLIEITVDGKPWVCRCFKGDKIEVINISPSQA